MCLRNFYLSANVLVSKVCLSLRKVSAIPFVTAEKNETNGREERSMGKNRFAPLKAEIDIAHDIVPTERGRATETSVC